MTDLILLTGFLGSGKTTLMKRLLDSYADHRIGVIINEFGSINIDAQLVEKDGVQMAELSNGSIFCACIKDKFVESLIEMAWRDLEFLFIEASGLADPANMEHILSGIAHRTDDGYTYRGSLCIADAENYLDLAELLPAIKSQTEYAQAIILNKIDLVDQEELEEVKEKVREFNKDAEIYPTSFCDVNIRDIVDQMGMMMIHKEARESSNTWQNRANTFNLIGTETLPFEKLQAFLEEILESSYRIKGFAVTDQGVKEISTVGKNMYINDWSKPVERNEIVVISSIGLAMMSKLTKGLDAHLKGLLELQI